MIGCCLSCWGSVVDGSIVVVSDVGSIVVSSVGSVDCSMVVGSGVDDCIVVIWKVDVCMIVGSDVEGGVVLFNNEIKTLNYYDKLKI